MKLAAFDLEIFKEIPEGETDWKQHRPLGISCLAILTNDGRELIIGNDGDDPRALNQKELRAAVSTMQALAETTGHTFVTVNGLGFDFDILAEESDMTAECADLAINHHCDMMLMSVAKLGWPVGLQALAEGASVEAKLKEVTLKDGSALTGMDGSRAPELWQAGEYDAVLAYLKQDVQATLDVAETALKKGYLGWNSSKGRWWHVVLPFGEGDGRVLPTVAECLRWRRPDTSWMSDPITRESLMAWTLDGDK